MRTTHQWNKNRFFLFLLFLLQSHATFSQKSDALELEGGLSGMKGGVSYYFGGKYVSNLNSYIGFSFGGMMNYAHIEKTINGHLYDGNSTALIGLIGTKFSTPVYRHIGITADLNFMFEPIPFSIFTLGQNDDEDETKSVYNGFNPGIGAQAGAFYQKKYFRLVVGGGVSSYNPYCPYYKYNHLSVPHNDCLISIFVRIYGLLD